MVNREYIKKEIEEEKKRYVEDYQSFVEWIQSRTPDFIPEKFIVFSTKCETFNGEHTLILEYKVTSDGKWIAGYHIGLNNCYDLFVYEIVQSVVFGGNLYFILKRE